MNDEVNRPAHYNAGKIEAFDYIADSLGEKGVQYYCEGNIKKYLHRWRYKKNPVQDLMKAKWYLERLIEINQK
jgi:hypothetical protein